MFSGSQLDMTRSIAGGNLSSGRASQPVCWIDRLPNEVKTRIAQLCDEQDEAWRTRLEKLRFGPRPWLRACGAEDWEQKGGQRLPPSLGALFCTSKAWSEIAAPFRFKSLTHKQCLDPRFRLELSRTRGHHVRHLALRDLDTTTGTLWKPVVEMLPAMRNITAIDLDADGPVLTQWDEDSDPQAPLPAQQALELSMIRRAVWQLIAQCEKWSLCSLFSPARGLPFPQQEIPAASFRLRHLRLKCYRSRDTAILGMLAPYATRLESLEIDFVVSCEAEDISSLPPAYPFPNLRHLTIFAHETWGDDAFQIRLADACAATLRSLRIEVVEMDREGTADDAAAFAKRYPSLRTLHLCFDASVARSTILTIVGSITQTRFPVLHTLSIEGVPLVDLTELPADSALRRGGFKRIRDDITADAASAPLLVRYCRPTSAPFDKRLIDSAARSLGTDTSGATRHCIEQDEADLLGDGALSRQLDETVDWLTRRVKHMRMVGDATALARLAEALEGVAAERWMIEM